MSSGKERTKKYCKRLRENEEKYLLWLKTKTAKEKIDYLQTKATQPEVLRAKQGKGKEKKAKEK